MEVSLRVEAAIRPSRAANGARRWVDFVVEFWRARWAPSAAYQSSMEPPALWSSFRSCRAVEDRPLQAGQPLRDGVASSVLLGTQAINGPCTDERGDRQIRMIRGAL